MLICISCENDSTNEERSIRHLSAPPFGLFSSLYFITNEERSTTGSLLMTACRKLEPDDKMEVCEPTHKI